MIARRPATGIGRAPGPPLVRPVRGGADPRRRPLRLGEDRSFQGEVALAAIDLESIPRIESDVRRPASGKISGRITLAGPTRAARPLPRQGGPRPGRRLARQLPVFREIDRFLGAARGGLFEDGDLTGTIANRQLIVEVFTLEGRLVQLHATGTVGFDGQLNLEVLINTNQIIPETGQALVTRIPGLRRRLAAGARQAMLQVANFLSNRLLKLRVTGTIRNPSVAIDPTILVTDTAVAFFAGVLSCRWGS